VIQPQAIGLAAEDRMRHASEIRQPLLGALTSPCWDHKQVLIVLRALVRRRVKLTLDTGQQDVQPPAYSLVYCRANTDTVRVRRTGSRSC
jgi:hypothetical protein